MKCLSIRLIQILLIIAFLFKNSSESIKIVNPPELVSQFNKHIEFSLSHFGNVQENFETIGKLYYNTSDLNNDACSPFTSKFENYSVESPPIVLVDRGNCTFVTKARNVQHAGGSVVLLVNNEPRPVSYILMIDDGTAFDIQIPVVLISQDDGRKIKNFIKNNANNKNLTDNIIIDVKLYNRYFEKVQIDLFLTSSEQLSYKFIKEIASYYPSFEGKIKLVPYYVTHPSNKTFDQNYCVSNGKYCTSSFHHSLNGRVEIIENLYQKCIHLYYPLEESTIYFDYMKEFRDKCYKLLFYEGLNKCRESIFEKLKISKESIEECLKSSFNSKELTNDVFKEKDNKILELEYKKKIEYDVTSQPVVYINKKILKGRFTAGNCLKAVCAVFTKPPAICEDLLKYGTQKKRIYIIVFSLIGAIIIINILIFVICRKYIAKIISDRLNTNSIDIDGRINTTVSRYMKLKDTSK